MLNHIPFILCIIVLNFSLIFIIFLFLLLLKGQYRHDQQGMELEC